MVPIVATAVAMRNQRWEGKQVPEQTLQEGEAVQDGGTVRGGEGHVKYTDGTGG